MDGALIASSRVWELPPALPPAPPLAVVELLEPDRILESTYKWNPNSTEQPYFEKAHKAKRKEKVGRNEII